MKRTVALSAFFLLIALAAMAQAPAGITDKPQIGGRRPVPAVQLREGDVMWSKRVWRTIDLREKFNHPLYYPEQPTQGRMSLFDAVKTGLLSGEITGFDNPLFDETFTAAMSRSQIELLFRDSTNRNVRDNASRDQLLSNSMERPLQSAEVKGWWLMEDWFFDKQRSVMEVRLLGMCPLRERKSAAGDLIGYQPMFWLHYGQLRAVLARFACFNTKNDAQYQSYDDVLTRRMFSSYIHRESRITDGATPPLSYPGLEAQFESERIRSALATMEHDFWNH